MKQTWRRCSVRMASLLAVGLAACGGGGGGGGDPAPAPSPGYPTLTTSATFVLPALAEPVARPSASGSETGRVVQRADMPAPAGVSVELLDASDPATPATLATVRTDAQGGYALPVVTSIAAVPARARWIRATLADGTVLRAYATGWTEVSPASEATLQEATRLYKAAAWGGRNVTTAEFAAAQDTLGLVWRSRHGNLDSAAAVQALVPHLRLRGPWNRVVEGWRATSAPPLGDLAALVRTGGAALATDVTDPTGATQALDFTTNCFGLETGTGFCGYGNVAAQAVGEQFTLTNAGSTVVPYDAGGDTTLTRLLDEIGRQPLLEFPARIGTRELLNRPRHDVAFATNLRAAVRVVRRTYDPEAVQALGTTVTALPVVLDYEVAVLDRTTGVQTDYLLRHKRWFVADIGRVRMEVTALVRTGEQLTRRSWTAVARASATARAAYADPPVAGAMDVVERGLSHYHAVYSTATGKVYAGVPDGGGRVLELDPRNLQTLRSVDTGAPPRRLAVSGDGSRLHVGLDGGLVAEFRLADLVLVGTTAVPAVPGGRAQDRVYDLQVDPYDARRVLALTGNSNVFGGTGPVMMLRAGSVAMYGPSLTTDDYGWPIYSPGAVGWSAAQPDAFIVAALGSPSSLYRLTQTGQLASELARLPRDDDIGTTESFAEIVTDSGRVLDARTLAARRTLAYAPLTLKACQRLDQGSVLCGLRSNFASYEPWLHLDAATGAFKGAYGRLDVPATNGCTGQVVRADTGGANWRVTPTGDGRVLVSSMDGPLGGATCNLQVWTLHGVTP